MAGPRRAGRVLPAAGIVLLVAGALIGGDAFGVRESLFGSATPAPRPVAVSPFTVSNSTPRPTSVLVSQPWWQGVRNLSGTATGASTTFAIGSGVSQWRIRWSCTTGRLLAQIADVSAPLIDSSCPGTGTAYSTRTGATQLHVSASAAWTAQIAQEVDVPLVEPPLQAMTAPGSHDVRTGSFYGIAQKSVGRLTVYRLATGRYALRLTNFYVSPNIDLQLRLDPLRAPHSTRQYLATRSVLVAPLPVTAGSLNFVVPAGTNPLRYGSIVIWCPTIVSAYAAVTLRPVS